MAEPALLADISNDADMSGNDNGVPRDILNSIMHYDLLLRDREDEIERLRVQLQLARAQNSLAGGCSGAPRVPRRHFSGSTVTGADDHVTEVDCAPPGRELEPEMDSAELRQRADAASNHSGTDEISLASTTWSQVQLDHKLLIENVIPHLLESVQILEHNDAVSADARQLRQKFTELALWNLEKIEHAKAFARALRELTYLQRQATAFSNRELHSKQLSHKLEYLFSIFADPKRYGINELYYHRELRDEVLGILNDCFHLIGPSL